MAQSAKDILIIELKDMISDLREDNKSLRLTLDKNTSEIASLRELLLNAQEENKYLRKMIFGTKSEKRKVIDYDENQMTIFDLFNIDYNSKKIISKIYEIISENIKKNQDYEIENETIKLRNYIIQEINELPFEFVMKRELEISEILKLYNLKIDPINYASILERAELLIDIISTLQIAKILVLPNLKTYLSEDELVALYKYSLYNNVKLLLIERYNTKKLEYEKTMLIDETFDEEIL